MTNHDVKKAVYEGPHTLTCEKEKANMKKSKINMQFFASIDDVISANAESFGEEDGTKASFEAVSSKLKELGYDVLINHREKAEFVPSTRLNEVISQRETFKQQAEQAIIDLNKLKEDTNLSEEAQTKINNLISQNEGLLEQLQEVNVQLEIMSGATDAINPKDVLPFIDMKKVKLDKNGKVVSGVKEELDRLRSEKPYLFNGHNSQGKSKGGFDGQAGGSGGTQKSDMNAAIRRAAFGSSRSF